MNKVQMSIPTGLSIKNLMLGEKQAIMLGIERTNSLHGLFVRGTDPMIRIQTPFPPLSPT
jgi:hypothetical protein